MFILRILLKAVLLPVILLLFIVKIIVKIGMELSSIFLGALMLFAAGCIIYTVTKQAWSQTFLLFLIEGILVAVTIGTGIIESVVDAALMGILSL